jgi:hypothetical protein
MKQFIGLLFLALILAGCGSTLRFDQTCVTCVKSQRFSCLGDECPSSFMVGSDALVTITETGENIFLTPILLEEQINAKSGIPVTIAKINGKVMLTANDFKSLWLLYPKAKNEACYKNVELPEGKIEGAVFELFSGKLLLSATNYKNKYFFDDEDNKWIVKDAVKGAQ